MFSSFKPTTGSISFQLFSFMSKYLRILVQALGINGSNIFAKFAIITAQVYIVLLNILVNKLG